MAIDPDVQVLIDALNERIDDLPLDATLEEFGGGAGALTVDNNTALLAAVASGRAIRLGRGSYAFDVTVPADSLLTIRGESKGRSELEYRGGSVAFAPTNPDARTYHQHFSHFALTADSNGGVGFDLASVSAPSMSHVTLSGFDVGVRVRSDISGGAVYGRFYDVTTLLGLKGLEVDDKASNEHVFTACRFGGEDIGIHVKWANGLKFFGVAVEGCATGVRSDAGGSVPIENTWFAPRVENNGVGFHVADGRHNQVLFPFYQGNGVDWVDESGWGNLEMKQDRFSAGLDSTLLINGRHLTRFKDGGHEVAFL